MKGELWGLVSVVASGSVVYGGFSQTPWVRVPQLPFFTFLLLSQQAEFHLTFVFVIRLLIYNIYLIIYDSTLDEMITPDQNRVD